MNLKHELQSIISGIGNHSAKDFIKAAAHYIRESQKKVETLKNLSSQKSKKQRS